MSDTQHLFGKILTPAQGDRDAVHVAVAPMIAACLLGPGDHVGINAEGKADDKARAIGIVDPFLTVNVEAGQRFFVFLYPNSITSLTHRWSHPAFPEQSDTRAVLVNGLALSFSPSEAEDELRRMCESWEGPDYDQLMEALRGEGSGSTTDEYGDIYGFSIGDEYLSMYGTDAHGSIPDHRRFWDLAEIVVGRRLDNRPQYFSCSC